MLERCFDWLFFVSCMLIGCVVYKLCVDWLIGCSVCEPCADWLFCLWAVCWLAVLSVSHVLIGCSICEPCADWLWCVF